MSHLDGNVLAGQLSEIFSVDMTIAHGTCASCHDERELARAMVYESGTDFVVRCANCGDVLMTVVRAPGDLRVELRGIRMLRIPT